MAEFLPGDIIRFERNKLGLSLRDFAKKVGVNYVSLSRFESNEAIPKYKILKKIAYNLGKRVSDFFPPEPVVGALIHLKIKGKNKTLSKNKQKNIADEAKDLPGINAVYELEKNEILMNVWASSPEQLEAFVFSFLNEFREHIQETSTMIILKRHPSTGEDYEGHSAQRFKQMLKERMAKEAKVSAWLEIDVGYQYQRMVVDAIGSIPHVLEVYNVLGNTDVTCRIYGDSWKAISSIEESIRKDLKGVLDIKIFKIQKVYQSKPILKVIQSCNEFISEIHHQLKSNPDNLMTMEDEDLHAIVGYLDCIVEDVKEITDMFRLLDNQ